MTKAEAIKELKMMLMDNSNTGAMYNALKLAIDALESQERQELIVGSYLIEEPSCSEKQINMAIGAITHMLNIGYYSEDMEDAPNAVIDALSNTLNTLDALECVGLDNNSTKVDKGNDELISRQDAIACAISGRVRALPTGAKCEDWIRTEEVRQSILNLPSAQPERKKGEWIDTGETPFTNNEGQLIHEKMCSKCKSIAYFRSVCGIMIANNVCPNCGDRKR